VQGWVDAKIGGSVERHWFPVFRANCGGHGHVLGLTPTGSFVEGSRDPVVLSEASAVRFLFLLEPPLEELRSAVQASLVSAGLQSVALPVSAIVAAALRGTSDYWAALAASWLEQDREQHPDLQGLISEAVASRWARQHTRHRLRRFIRG
jgi:hypothetical protein